jgi:hypothetical protein
MELTGSEARIQQPGSAIDWMPIMFHVCWVGASDVYYGISMCQLIVYGRASVTKRLSVKLFLVTVQMANKAVAVE